MARAVYVICSELIAQDKDTNQLSLFSVVESLTAHRSRVKGSRAHSLSVKSKMVAVWMKDSGDEEHEFEQQWVFVLPGDSSEILAAQDRFRFPKDKHLQRLVLNMVGWPPVTESGVMRIESRIRREGSHEWITQDYPIVVEVEDDTTNGDNGQPADRNKSAET